MSKSVLGFLLAIAATPVFAETVSSTSILTTLESNQAKDKTQATTSSTKLNFLETIEIRNSLVKIPSIPIAPQTNNSASILTKVNHLIDSVSPISSSIQTDIAVSVIKTNPSPQATSSISSQFPKISRSSLLSETADNSHWVNPAPETERIASVFGWRIRPFSGRQQMHNGIDYGAPLGSPVVAAKDGIVTKVVSGCLDFRQRWCGSQFGNWIEIDHGNGMVATYAHLLNNSITVREGTLVWQNQEIAKVGSSGWSTGAHLDFRIKLDDKYQNPADYVKN
jgi:murein DD-endopeptidase MepM/ murein hydrolase activator NlpD